MVRASISPSQMRAGFPSRTKVALRLRGRWVRAARDGRDIALRADLMRHTVAVIAGLAFGKDIDSLESGEAVIHSSIVGVVDPARQRLRDEPSRREQPHNLLQAMIGAGDPPNSGLEDRPVAGKVLTMLMAGAEQPFSSAARRSAMPSGSGPCRCPGRCLALREMKVAMAMLLSSLDIDAVHTSDGVLAEERRAFATTPVGLRMR